MPHNFDDSLPMLTGPPDPQVLQMMPNLRLGVCAMGPVGEGDEVLSMRVWVSQKAGAKVAFASGEGGKHLGSHAVSPREKLPFKGPGVANGEAEGKWMIQTQLEEGSAEFAAGEPALATAIALIEHKDGSREVLQWSRAVAIRKGHAHPHPSPTT